METGAQGLNRPDKVEWVRCLRLMSGRDAVGQDSSEEKGYTVGDA